MENMDKGLTVPKQVLINQPKIPKCPKFFSAQIVCPSPKVWVFNEKRLHWASVVRVSKHHLNSVKHFIQLAHRVAKIALRKKCCILYTNKLAIYLTTCDSPTVSSFKLFSDAVSKSVLNSCFRLVSDFIWSFFTN